jgi:hypothetical protein
MGMARMCIYRPAIITIDQLPAIILVVEQADKAYLDSLLR